MLIGIPKEIMTGETRVAMVPSLVHNLARHGHQVIIETGAGEAAFFPDAQYVEMGAQIAPSSEDLYRQAEVIFKVQPPQYHPSIGRHEAEMIREGAILICFLNPFSNLETIEILARRRISAYAMEFIPRIARAQNMDALSAMATIAGYKAVMLAASRLDKLYPLMMTAAGTITPASVLVLGVGVAGLQAIATAKRLGAKVEAFDPRPAVRDQVKSVGAVFVEMELPKDSETAGGYAKEQPAEFLKKEQDVIASRLPKMDVVITTAQIFGKRAPLLITEEMVHQMKPGAIIIDLAAEQGGNCTLTVPGEIILVNGVTIIGAVNLPASVPADASLLYSHTVVNLFEHLYPAAGVKPDLTDEIAKSTLITGDGQVVNEQVEGLIHQGVTV